MREIIFRGKRISNGEWVEGFYYKAKYYRSDKELCHYITIPHPECKGLPSDHIMVYPETVGQYTGLTDMNGKKVFEGDIIRSDNGKQAAVSVVKFGEYYPKMFYAMLDMCCPGKRHLLANGFYAESVGKHEEMILFQSNCVEIIGNIHDNPELLEDGQ